MKTARRLDLVPAPTAQVCAVCREAPDRRAVVACERCGSLMDDRCYWRRVATVEETRRFWEEDDVETFAFICRACRS